MRATPDYWLTADGLALIGGWARDGLSRDQIAGKMGVNPNTITAWTRKYADLATVIGFGREVADRNVENALYKRAIGYEFTERKTLVRKNPDGTTQQEVTETKKQMAPDVIAQIFWLKNRRPADWRDRREIEVDGAVGLVQIVDDLPKA